MHRDPRAAEHAGQHGHQCDPDLHGGEKKLRILGQAACQRGAGDALALKHRKPRAARRNQREFAHREQPVQRDQQQDDNDFQTEAHGRAYRARRTLHIARLGSSYVMQMPQCHCLRSC